MRFTKKSSTEISKIAEFSIEKLIESYREIDHQSGWHQYLGNSKIGNVANAQALLISQYFDHSFDKKNKVLQTLIANQFDQEEIELNGGWSYKTNLTDYPTTECTSWVLLAFFKELDPKENTIKFGIQWLLNNQKKSSLDTGWGSIKDDYPRLYPTSLALRTLNKYNQQKSYQFQKGLNWLKQSVNSDGGWGSNPNEKSDLTHTSHAIITLIECGISKNSKIVKEAIEYLVKNIDVNKNWANLSNLGHRKDLEILDKRITFYHYSLAWIIIALNLTEKNNSKEYEILISQLIEEEIDGNWKHPFLNDSRFPTIWSKHDALKALKLHQEKISNVIKASKQKSKLKSTTTKKLYTNNDLKWALLSLLISVIALVIIKFIVIYPQYIKETLFILFLFILIYLRNPVKRYWRIAQSIFSLIVGLSIVPAMSLDLKGEVQDYNGISNFILNFILKETNSTVFIVLGIMFIFSMILDYLERRRIVTAPNI